MKRFLVVELYTLTIAGRRHLEREPCRDFDTIGEAEAWISVQDEPEIFEIEDQLDDLTHLMNDGDYRDNDDSDYELGNEDFHSDDSLGEDWVFERDVLLAN